MPLSGPVLVFWLELSRYPTSRYPTRACCESVFET